MNAKHPRNDLVSPPFLDPFKGPAFPALPPFPLPPAPHPPDCVPYLKHSITIALSVYIEFYQVS